MANENECPGFGEIPPGAHVFRTSYEGEGRIQKVECIFCGVVRRY